MKRFFDGYFNLMEDGVRGLETLGTWIGRALGCVFLLPILFIVSVIVIPFSLVTRLQRKSNGEAN